MEIVKGYLLRTTQGGKYGQIKINGDKVINNVLLLYPYGMQSNMQTEPNEGSMVLVFKVNCSDTNLIALPYNPVRQVTDLLETESSFGNPQNGTNKITFKANGDVTIDCTSTVTINGGTVNLADATSLVLNENADMSVTVTGGSSAGTYPVDINDAGQSKVNA